MREKLIEIVAHKPNVEGMIKLWEILAEFTRDTTGDFESMACITVVVTWDIEAKTTAVPKAKYLQGAESAFASKMGSEIAGIV